jgi:ATP-dependent DNA ligase
MLVLDGELVVISADKPDFRRLQRRTRPSPAALVAAVPVTFAAFDLLRVAARSVAASPYQHNPSPQPTWHPQSTGNYEMI